MQPNNTPLQPLDNQQYPSPQQPQAPAQPSAQFFQPTAPYPPQQMGQEQANPYAFQGYPQAQPPSKKRFKPALIVGGLIAVSIASLVGAYLLQPSRSTSASATEVFNNAVSNALRTSQFKQTNTTTNGTITFLYDVTNPSKPKVSSTTKLEDGSLKLSMEAYGTFDNSYFRITEDDSNFASAETLNKWVSARKDGKAEADEGGAVLSLIDPRYNFFGQFIFGNFSESDRQELAQFVSDKKVYAFEETKVYSASVDGQDCNVYDVTLNNDELANYNRLVAKKVGIDSSAIEQTLLSSGFSGTSARLFVSTKDQRLVKVEATDSDGVEVTINYSQFDATTVPDEPTPSLTYSQFSQASL